MTAAELNYLIYEKELLAIIYAIWLWQSYLEGQKFTAIIDHASLEYIQSQNNLSRRQAHWLETLQAHNFDIKYRLGKTNIIADALSRPPLLATISTVTVELLKISRLKDLYQEDEYFWEIFIGLQNSKIATSK